MTASSALPGRDSLETDVVIVGAGPAGLAVAIRIKQQAPDTEVLVVEKGASVGSHILSGAVIDPVGLDRLLPHWRSKKTPLRTPVRSERMLYLTERHAVTLPQLLFPPSLHNDGCFVASLGEVCRWLAEEAEALGVSVYPGFAASELLWGAKGEVVGIATRDVGLGPDGQPTDNFERGIGIHARYVLLGEGARGSLSKQLIAKGKLGDGRDPQKFGIGIKELWRVRADRHQPGLVQHSLGWPLDNRTGGGGFLYHLDEGLVSIGLVVHLNYADPTLSPFERFQAMKTHPVIAPLLDGGERLEYGARAITEGGYQSVPRLAYPGAALIGCAAGFMNVPRIKGSHNAMLSGILAADSVVAALAQGRAHDMLSDYDTGWRSSEIGADLKPVRNVKPLWSRFGTVPGLALAGLDLWTNRWGLSLFGTLRHGRPDHAATQPLASGAMPKPFRPDNVTTFDRATSVFHAGVSHREGQPAHLVLADTALQQRSELAVYGGPSTRYCPAGVYEWQQTADGVPRFVINAANCVHCKTCDIKDPNQNITWVVPEGGSGPDYRRM